MWLTQEGCSVYEKDACELLRAMVQGAQGPSAREYISK